MTLPRFTIGNRFSGQPVLPGCDFVPDVIVAGLSDHPQPTDDDPNTWTLEDSLRDNLLPRIQADGLHDLVLAAEESPWPVAKLDRISQWCRYVGVTCWAYGLGMDGDANCGDMRADDSAGYELWKQERRSLLPRLPLSFNLAYDLYIQEDETLTHWLVNKTELARTLIELYPDRRILPIVWHRSNRPPYRPLPVGLFRAMVRWAALMHGRVRWWFDEQDSVRSWDAADPYVRAFMEEAA